MPTRKRKSTSTQVDNITTEPNAEVEAAATETTTDDGLTTVPRLIGGESHPWCEALGGIPRSFGPPPEASDEAEPVIVEESPGSPRAGKVPVDPIGEVALLEDNGASATS